jgi:hypothetical protein
VFFPKILTTGLVEGLIKRKHTLSPEELEDGWKKRQEAATMRKSLIEDKKREKEVEHKKKEV